MILEPAAVGQLLLFLAFMGFGAKTLYQQRSFMAGKIGEKITGDNITIIEDPLAPEFAGLPFDYEGVPRKQVTLIENGIAKGVVSNSYYARLLQERINGTCAAAEQYVRTVSEVYGSRRWEFDD